MENTARENKHVTEIWKAELGPLHKRLGHAAIRAFPLGGISRVEQ